MAAAYVGGSKLISVLLWEEIISTSVAALAGYDRG